MLFYLFAVFFCTKYSFRKSCAGFVVCQFTV